MDGRSPSFSTSRTHLPPLSTNQSYCQQSLKQDEPVLSSCTGRFHYGDGTAKNRATALAGSITLHWPVPLRQWNRCKRRREASPSVEGVLVTSGFELSSYPDWWTGPCGKNSYGRGRSVASSSGRGKGVNFRVDNAAQNASSNQSNTNVHLSSQDMSSLTLALSDE
ncbi:hypothetical protein Tco_0424250 [Tanacetum coccineum]